MRYPIDQFQITQRFGLAASPVLGYAFHDGLDLACPVWTPLLAPEDGLAIARGGSRWAVFDKRGLWIAFKGSSGAEHWFYHLEANDPQINKFYKEGEVIGRTGNTGKSTGPHLHWGIKISGQWVDPLVWLKAGTAEFFSQLPESAKEFVWELTIGAVRKFYDTYYFRKPEQDADNQHVKAILSDKNKWFGLGDWLARQVDEPEFKAKWRKP